MPGARASPGVWPAVGRLFLNTIERVMRVMTHVNIGAALGMVAWLAWSGWMVVVGGWKVTVPRAPAPPEAPSPQRLPTVETCCFRPAEPAHLDRRPLQTERAERRLLARLDGGTES